MRASAPSRAACLASALLTCSAAVGCPRAAPPVPQRILLVSIDTLRADHVGVYGAPGAATPVLDGLARVGVRFDAAIAPTPLTLPSHASLLTGLEPARHGVHHNALFQLEPGFPTLAERLRDAGYATAACVGAFALDRRFGLARGFDHYDDGPLRAPDSGSAAARNAERTAERVVDAALEWLRGAPERFFLWVHLYDPHAEYRPPARFAARFPGDPYAAEIAFADAELGRLLAVLTNRYRQDTLAVVTSDHGEALGEHREPAHSYGLYDSTQRVPLLMAGAGLPAGRAVAELVRLVDVAPTLLELAGLPPLPAPSAASGRSLLPLLRGAPEEPRVAYLETLATRYDLNWSPLYGLRTRFEKYVRAPRPELYDLARDPGETHNLAAQQPERVAELDRQLDAWLPAGATAEPNRSLSAQLESLGYALPEAGAAAAARLGEVGGVDPKDEMGLVADLSRASALIAADRAAEALALLEPLRGAGRPAQILRFRAALQAGQLELAKQAALSAIEQSPESFEARYLLGLALERAGDLAAAEAAYAASARLNPGGGTPLTAAGRLAEARGERSAAADLYGRARAARLPDSEATWRLAALAIEDGQPEQVRPLLAELSPRELLDPDAARRLAEAESRAGRRADALARLEAALEAQPREWRLQLVRGELLERMERLEDALAAREAALALKPEEPAAQNDVAWNLARLGRNLDRALALAQTALERTGPEPAVLDTLATVRLARGEPERALASIDDALPAAASGDRQHLLELRERARAELARRAARRRAAGEGARTQAADEESAARSEPQASEVNMD